MQIFAKALCSFYFIAALRAITLLPATYLKQSGAKRNKNILSTFSRGLFAGFGTKPREK